MNNFTLSDIQALITESLLEKPTGNQWLDAIYDEQVGIIGHTNPYYRLFYLIAQSLKPQFVVELGAWRAIAASHFAVGNPDCEVVTVDIHREDFVAQQLCIEATNILPNLTYLNMWSWDAVDTIKAIDKKLDCLFIDAWHDYQYAKREWDLYSPLLADNALVICDDITAAYNFDGMLRFWDELPGEKFLNNDVHPGVPLGLVKFERVQPKRRGRPAKR
jgi:predicted O-methyltransferase YrrM